MAQCILFGTLLINSIKDMRTKMISITVLLVMAAAGVVHLILIRDTLSVIHWVSFLPGLLCLLLSIFRSKTFGMGDSLTILVMGFYFTGTDLMTILFISFVTAGFWALFLALVRKKGRTYGFPFLPFLLLGTMIFYLC